MSLYLLILLEFILFIITYQMFNQDFMSPPVMTLLVVLLGTIMVIPSVELWNVEIEETTYWVVFIGIITLIFSSYFAKVCFKREKVMLPHSPTVIHFSKSAERVIAFLCVVLTALYVIDALRVGRSYGGEGLGAIAMMKNAYMTGATGGRMNIFIRQGFKVVMALGYLSCIPFAMNVLICREKLRKNVSYFVAIVAEAVITIFSGSRTEILRIVSALLLSYVVLYRESKGWSRKSASLKNIIRKFLPILAVVLIIAFVSRTFVKTSGVATSDITSVILYASFYVGSPIQVLNIKLSYFDGIKELLFGTNSEIPVFVYLGNLNYGGNVDTIFGSIVTYNGLLKMVLYLFLVFFIGSAFYYKIYGTCTSYKRNLGLALFAYCYFVFTMSYYSVCTSLLLQFSNVTIFLLIWAFYILLVRVKIKVRL